MAEDAHDLRAVEHRMAAVSSVHKVVQAVWAMARAQQGAVEEAAADASVYLDQVDATLARLAGAPEPTPAEETLHVILGPEHPICGGLPRRVLEAIPDSGPLGLVGTRLHGLASAAGLDERVRFRLPAPTSVDELDGAAREVAREVLRHGADLAVALLHPVAGEDALRRVPLLTGRRRPVVNPPETYSPFRRVLEAVVEEAATGRLVVGLAEALRAEVRARIVAAGGARQASERQGEELEGLWRVLRQEQITGEVQEVVGARLATEPTS